MNRAGTHIVCGMLALLLVGCNLFKSNKSETHLARVKNVFLDKSEVDEVLPKKLSPEDSAAFVHNYIKRWATKQLLIEGAKRNLPDKQHKKYDEMVKEYRQELYIEAYKDMIISKKLDTLVTDTEIKEYFEANKRNFKLNRDLAKLRYVKLSKDFPDVDKIKMRIKRFDSTDRKVLNSKVLKFDAYSFNDSVWVDMRKIADKIPPLKKKKEDEYLKKAKFLQLSDSLSLYLVFLKDVRLHNEQAPISYVKLVIKQILLNKRKLEIAKKLEKNITKDALEDHSFEIYK